jgi:hypothetical protein
MTPLTPTQIRQAEEARRALLPVVNVPAVEARTEAILSGRDPEAILRDRLGTEHGDVYNTTELQEHFEVLGFAAPLVAVLRKADRVKGSMYFTHAPRLYYGFSAQQG